MRTLRSENSQVQSARQVPHPAASLLKLPVVGAFLAAAAHHALGDDLPTRITSLPDTDQPSVLAAFPDASLTLRQLAALAVVTSDNRAATRVLDAVGGVFYQRYLTAAGCTATDIPPGFDDDDLPSPAAAATTAEDQARILDYIWSTECCQQPLRTWMANNQRNNRLSARIAPPSLLPHKTGTLGRSIHDVGVLLAPDHRTTIVALCSEEPELTPTSLQLADLGSVLARLLPA